MNKMIEGLVILAKHHDMSECTAGQNILYGPRCTTAESTAGPLYDTKIDESDQADLVGLGWYIKEGRWVHEY